jgi:hypothetical protein
VPSIPLSERHIAQYLYFAIRRSLSAMPPSDFGHANVLDIVEELTTDESIQLIAGVGFWKTHAVERLGVPAIKVSSFPVPEISPSSDY